MAGSIAYGTNNENSDVDIRGFAVEAVDSILTGKAFEQVDDEEIIERARDILLNPRKRIVAEVSLIFSRRVLYNLPQKLLRRLSS